MIHKNQAGNIGEIPTVMLHTLEKKGGETIMTGWCTNLNANDELRIDLDRYKVVKVIEKRDHKGVFDKDAKYTPSEFKYVNDEKDLDAPPKRVKTKEGSWKYKSTEKNKNSFFRAVVQTMPPLTFDEMQAEQELQNQ